MDRFTLVTLYRSLMRHKLYAVLNIGGLAVGIAVFLILGLYVRFQTSFESWIPDNRQIYVVTDWWDMPGVFMGPTPTTMGGWLEQIKADFPETIGTRIYNTEAVVLRNGTGTAQQLALVDPAFSAIFDLPAVRGQLGDTLADPSNLVITQAMVDKYFSGIDPIGKSMTLTIAGSKYNYHISAVVKTLPRNTDLSFDMVARLIPKRLNSDRWYHWGTESVLTYLRFANPATAKSFEGRLDDFVERHASKDMGPHPTEGFHETLVPLRNVRFLAKGLRLTIVSLGVVGLLTLLIAMVNHVNLATARASLRAREVAMRKVLGADHGTLMRQFLGEAIAIAAGAALVGLALAELGLPFINAATGLSLSIPYLLVGPSLVLLALLVGVCAGFYPALLLARFPAAAVLSSARSPGGGRTAARVREGLVVFQFALAIAFIIGTLVLFAQTRHVRRTDLGFRRDGLLVIPSMSNSSISVGQRVALLKKFKEIPGVAHVTIADAAPGDGSNQIARNIALPNVPGDGPALQEVFVGPDFFQTLGTRLIAGRLFDPTRVADECPVKTYGTPCNVIVNRMGASVLGFTHPKDAINKTVGTETPYTIVGVVDDMRFYSPREPLRPTFYQFKLRGPDYSIAIVRFSSDPRATLEAIRAAWRAVSPDVPLVANTGEQSLAVYYKDDEHVARLFGIGASLAVLIGCVGLWGLASFNTARRVKEIGIRKTLGASSGDIVRLLVGQFLRPVLLANLFAWPLAYTVMQVWLAGFEDRIALSPLYFGAATLLALAIACFTVMAQSIRAARAAPAWALRHE